MKFGFCRLMFVLATFYFAASVECAIRLGPTLLQPLTDLSQLQRFGTQSKSLYVREFFKNPKSKEGISNLYISVDALASQVTPDLVPKLFRGRRGFLFFTQEVALDSNSKSSSSQSSSSNESVLQNLYFLDFTDLLKFDEPTKNSLKKAKISNFLLRIRVGEMQRILSLSLKFSDSGELTALTLDKDLSKSEYFQDASDNITNRSARAAQNADLAKSPEFILIALKDMPEAPKEEALYDFLRAYYLKSLNGLLTYTEEASLELVNNLLNPIEELTSYQMPYASHASRSKYSALYKALVTKDPNSKELVTKYLKDSVLSRLYRLLNGSNLNVTDEYKEHLRIQDLRFSASADRSKQALDQYLSKGIVTESEFKECQLSYLEFMTLALHTLLENSSKLFLGFNQSTYEVKIHADNARLLLDRLSNF